MLLENFMESRNVDMKCVDESRFNYVTLCFELTIKFWMRFVVHYMNENTTNLK